MSQELIELIIFGEIININEMVYVDYYTISIFIVILSMVLINKKINQEIYELKNFINFEINNLREQNIAVKIEFNENINNINCKIDKEIINVIGDMNYKFDILKAKFNSVELSRDELFKTFNEKIDENSVIMNSVIERIDNFELNSQNNNIVIGIYYNGNLDIESHKRIYINLLSETIDLTEIGAVEGSQLILYISEIFKLKNLKNIKINRFYSYNHCLYCSLICDSGISRNILNKDIFKQFKQFDAYGTEINNRFKFVSKNNVLHLWTFKTPILFFVSSFTFIFYSFSFIFYSFSFIFYSFSFIFFIFFSTITSKFIQCVF
jgi:hypothetical protein